MEMAEVVSMEPRRKYQEKFLQRFFDGAISNFFLDSFDFNESHHHQLPPSRLANRWAEETISDSTQIDEGSLYSMDSGQTISEMDSVQRILGIQCKGDSFNWIFLPVSSSKPVGRRLIQWILGILDSVQRINAKDSGQRVKDVHLAKDSGIKSGDEVTFI